MYYILFIIIILFISINKRTSERWSNSQNDKYFSFFNTYDFKFRSCQNERDCREKYINAEIKLSPYEIKNLEKIIKNFRNLTNNKYSRIFNNITIIKVRDTIENSMPHTRKENIILPKKWIERAISKFLDDPNDIIFPKLLSHEQFHIYQRYYQDNMDILYLNFWNMEKLRKEIPKEILELNRTNPDALPNYNWLFRRKNDLIFPLCLYKKNANSLSDTENIYFRLDNNHNFIDILNDLENRKLLINDSEYVNFFGDENANNYHPNEISASLFELIIEDIIKNKEIDRSPAYNSLKQFLENKIDN